MNKFGLFISKNKFTIIIVSLVLLVFSFIGMKATKINYDIMLYLPEDMDTIKGQSILTEDFNMGAFSIATVENMSSNEVLNLENKIKEIDSVGNVVSIYDVIGSSIPIDILPNEVKSKLHKDNVDIMFITFKDSTSSNSTINAVKEIRTITNDLVKQGGTSALMLDTMELSDKEIAMYIVIAVIFCIIVLEISLDSYLVPFILLINIGFAILLNLGTNIFLGQISYITKALAAVLQLGVTMDFSIFMYHSYEKNKTKYKRKRDAMSKSINETFLSVTGSSLTTIVGFLALCAMKLTLGKDLGIVMAKGVLLGVASVLTLFPSLLLAFDKQVEKTKHKSLMIDFSKFNKFTFKHCKLVLIIFLIVLIPAFLAYRKVEVYYKIDKSLPQDLVSIKTNHFLSEEFNIISPSMILIDKKVKNDKINEMTNEIISLGNIEWVLSLKEITKLGLSEDALPDRIKNIFESDKYQMFLVNSSFDIATDELSKQLNDINTIVKKYDKNAIIAGEGPLTKDLIDTYASDYSSVNLLSIGCIFVVLLFIFKSLTLPAILILAIEFAIFANLGFSYFSGTSLPFIAPITLSTIQLGATIDYAILVTTTYVKRRKSGIQKEEAIIKTMNYAAPSVLISAMCFFAATFGVGIYSKIAMIGSICVLISRGALISVAIVLTILPSLLVTFDRIFIKNKEMKNMKNIKNISKKISVYSLLFSLLFASLPINAFALTKNESVYSKLNYDGSVKNTFVSEEIINSDNLDTIEDYSELKDILNISNDATFKSNNYNLSWNALGKDIIYKGTISKDLPISLKVTYLLNNKETNIKDMLGKNGKITIRIKYINNDKHSNLYTPFVVTMGTILSGVNNKNIEIVNGKVINNGINYVLAGIAIPGLYESLQLSELKNMDTITINYDTTKFELPSIYSIATCKLIDSQDLKIFDKMDSLYNKVDALSENMDKIDDGAKELNNGLNTLYDSYGEFNNGVITLNENFNTLNNGVQELNTKINKVLNDQTIKDLRNTLPELENYSIIIKDTVNKYITDTTNTSETLEDISDSLLNVINYIKSVEPLLQYTAINNIDNYVEDIDKVNNFVNTSVDFIINLYEINPEGASPELIILYNQAKKLKDEESLINLTKLKNELDSLKTNLENIQNELLTNTDILKLTKIENKITNFKNNMNSNIDNLNKTIEIINALPDKINDISTGLDEFESGINSLSEGTIKMYEGTNTLSSYSNQIYEGIKKLKEGSNELSNGITKYNNEGIQKISSFVNTNIKSTVNKLKQLSYLGNSYTSYAGINKNDKGDTKFVLVIDSLNAPKEERQEKQVKKPNLWQRILNLFK